MKVFEAFRLDIRNQCLWREEERMPLTPKAFDLLRYLIEHRDCLVTHEEILEAVWPETYVNPEGIRKYIVEIRKLLGDRPGQPHYIETLPKRGYRFIAPVTEEHAWVRVNAAADASRNMVGRDAPLSELSDCLEKARCGARQVVFVTGEAGIGKTTLVDAFEQHCAGYAEVRLARGQCIEGFGGKEAYYPVLEALGLLVGTKDRSLVEILARQAPTLLTQFPSLVKPDQKDSLERNILGSTQGRMVREICEALEAMAAEFPLVVILEDLHWVDHSTLDVISAFARRRGPARVLMIGTYRPGEADLAQSPLKTLKQDLQVHDLCREIAVQGLGEAEVSEYLAREFEGADFPAGLAGLIHHNAGGNALFMVAIVRDIVKRGLIAPEGGKWSLQAPLGEIYRGIPETLQQMLEAQFEQLSGEEQRILQCAAICGQRFAAWAIAAMLETPAAAVEETLEQLAKRGQFIRFEGVCEEANGNISAHYEFAHGLYRQALYARLSSWNRSRLHLSLAEALRPCCAAGRVELAAALALHFEEGRDYQQAARYLMVAAGNAARRFAHTDSIEVLDHALELARLGGAGGRLELEIGILQQKGDAHYALGAMSDSAAAYESAVSRAAEAGLRTAEIGALARLAAPAWYLDPARGNGVCERAIEASREYGDPMLLARTQLAAACFRLVYDDWRQEDAETCIAARETIRQLSDASIPENVLYAYVQVTQGEYEEALRQSEAGMNPANGPAACLLAIGAKTLALIGLGRFGQLLRIIRAGREVAEKNGEDPWVFIFREAWLRALCFDFEGVHRLSELMMRSDTVQHCAQAKTMAMVAAGYSELFLGRCDQALQYFAEARDAAASGNFLLHWRWRLRAQLGCIEARLHAGDVAAARIELDAFRDAALAAGEPNMHAFAWDTGARVAVARQDHTDALRCIERALAVVGRFDIPVVAWRVHATAWDVYNRAGESERAASHREQAKAAILRLANSFEEGEALRESLLTAEPVQRILG
jgi:DNA-binding winged helix-turn-helix (wHTH) protein/tetratricopeptide (TPR) repeat protein